MALMEIWRGQSKLFDNGQPHKDGGHLMRVVLETTTRTVTFEIEDGKDAMAQTRWATATGPASQFILNAASLLSKKEEVQ